MQACGSDWRVEADRMSSIARREVPDDNVPIPRSGHEVSAFPRPTRRHYQHLALFAAKQN